MKRPSIAALIFDFDGLLVDTETPAFESWRVIYADYGHDLSLDLWKDALGTSHGFDPLDYLVTLLGRPLDRAADLARRQELKRALSADQPLDAFWERRPTQATGQRRYRRAG